MQEGKKIEAISTAPLKGFRDFYPEDQRLHSWVFGKMGEVAERFGFQPYNGPVLESHEMYVAKSGDELGGEQLYHFVDKGERGVAVRPEMTPTLARMVAAKANELAFPLRWYSTPNLLRYERPQRGRVREHWQLNVDIIGSKSLFAEAEIIELGVSLMKSLAAPDEAYTVRINNRRFLNELLSQEFGLGSEQVPLAMKMIDRRAKIDPAAFEQGLAEAGLQTSHIAMLQELFECSLEDLNKRFPNPSPGAAELIELFKILEARGLGKHCKFDLGIVRGIAYYTGTVFELFDNHPENRRALFGGGRYDNLLSLFNRPEISAVGFGLGDVTIKNFLETHGLLPDLRPSARVMVLFPDAGAQAVEAGMKLAGHLREQGIATEISFPGDSKLDKQFKLASKRGVDAVAMIGSNEVAAGTVTIKDMHAGKQESVSLASAVASLRALIEEKVDGGKLAS